MKTCKNKYHEGVKTINEIKKLDDFVRIHEKIQLTEGEYFDDVEFAIKSILHCIRKSYDIKENSTLYKRMYDTLDTYTCICSLNAALGVIFLMVDDNFKKATEKYDHPLAKQRASVILFDNIFNIYDFIYKASFVYRHDNNIK